jgi:hypothetical protein
MPEEGFDFPQYITLHHIPLLDCISGNIHYDPGLEVSDKGEDTEGEFRVDSECLMPDQVFLEFLGSTPQNHGPGVLKVALLVWIVAWNSFSNGEAGEVITNTQHLDEGSDISVACGVLLEVLVSSTKDYNCKVSVGSCLLDLLYSDGVEVCNEQLVWNYNMGEMKGAALSDGTWYLGPC